MARNISIYNHKKRIKSFQPGTIKAIYPGMICQFKYNKKETKDPLPLILCLWNDYQGYKLHGLNLNYLSEFQIKLIFTELMDKGGRADDHIPLKEEDIASVETQVEPEEIPEDEAVRLAKNSEYEIDKLPNRNLLKKPFTRLRLPAFKDDDIQGNPISKAQAERQMKLLYTSVLKKYVKQFQVYRSYSYDLIKAPRVITYDTKGLVK